MLKKTVPDDGFAFGLTVVVPRRRALLRHGVKVDIGARTFDLLMTLVGARETVLSKEHLRQRLWPDRVVEENTIEAQVSALRRALGEDRLAIRTVAGRGYQFVGDLRDVHPEGDGEAG